MKTTQYTIRPACPADLDRLVELMLVLQDHVEAANPDLWRMKPEARGDLKGQLVARLTATDACALVAEHARDGVIGVIFGRVVTNKRYIPERAGQIDQAVVCQDHRRAGVGTRLVAGLCRFFAEQNVHDLTLRYVSTNAEAASFWTALGFAPRIVVTGAARQAVEERLAQNRQG